MSHRIASPIAKKPSFRKDLRRILGADPSAQSSYPHHIRMPQKRQLAHGHGHSTPRHDHRTAMQDSLHIIQTLFHDESDVSILEIMVLVDGAYGLLPVNHAFKSKLDVYCEVSMAIRPTNVAAIRGRRSMNSAQQSTDVAMHARKLARKNLLNGNAHSRKYTSIWSVEQHGEPQWSEHLIFRFPVRSDQHHFTADMMLRVVDYDCILDQETTIGECIVMIPIDLLSCSTMPNSGEMSDTRRILCTLLNKDWSLSRDGDDVGTIRTSISAMYIGNLTQINNIQ